MIAISRLVSALLIALCLFATPAFATHIVGGDLNIIHVSGDNYRLRLTLYYDLYRGLPGSLGNEVNVHIFSKRTNAYIGSQTVLLVLRTRVTYTNPLCVTGADSLKTERLRYEKIMQLPAAQYSDSVGYYAMSDMCCRNGAITNILEPGKIGQLFYMEFPPTTYHGKPFRNSSPTQFQPLSDYGCVGRLFHFDFSGIDVEGDSIVYSMAKPWSGNSSNVSSPGDTLQIKPLPYPTVEWKPGIDLNNQIPGTPALAINGKTGVLTMKPNKVGLYVFAVQCAEYRNGRYLGLTRRDFQILILDCEKNTVPVISLRNAAGEPTEDGDTVNVRFNDGLACFTVNVVDSVPDQMNIVINAPGLEGYATITQSAGSTRPGQMIYSTSLCVEPCAKSEGILIVPVNLKVTDNACSLPNFSTLKVFMKVYPVNTPPTLSNVVTPNGDGLNDLLSWLPLPVTNCANNFEGMQIYNIWGKLMLKTRNPAFVWPDNTATAGLYNVSYVYSGKRYTQWVEVVR